MTAYADKDKGGRPLRFKTIVESEISGGFVACEQPGGLLDLVRWVDWEALPAASEGAWDRARADVLKRLARDADARAYGFYVSVRENDSALIISATPTQLRSSDGRTWKRATGSRIGGHHFIGSGRPRISPADLLNIEELIAGRGKVDIVAERKKLGQRNEVPSP